MTKALELGYSGVAYNRTIKGVMSDRDRCSIPLLTIASFLKHSPLLLSNVNFHRDLLGLPRASPFRQYTRLTVCTETPAQSQALNSGNPILKTYDLVAVKPLNQSAFELACEKLEVRAFFVCFVFVFILFILICTSFVKLCLVTRIIEKECKHFVLIVFLFVFVLA